MPTYTHLCKKCKHEWEDFYSIKDPVPDTCPKCKNKGDVQRLISGGSGKGIVTLYGQDLKDHVKSEANRFKKAAYKNETAYADLLGHDKYQNLQTQLDKKRR